ncbi:uncharacterized protein LOC133923137 [Phragmites australis]|uniref:uncharacterized protein LOC133923137 n=1 Tax=Phragmites australis TaxID=29695 RepID=UPI002D7990AC|nr:uncharacterized protein LOC133923137 [Phragmites australis]
MTMNYTSWVIHVQAMMDGQGIWEVVEPVASASINKKKDKKARSHLFQALLEDLLMQVARKKTEKEEGETLDQYTKKLNTMSVGYASLVEMLDDIALVKQFYNLDNMPFEEIVGRLKAFEERARPRASDSNSNSDSQLLLTRAEWQVWQKDSDDSSSSNKGKYHPPSDSNHGQGGRGCGRGGHGGTSRDDKESDLGGGRRNKSHIKCYNCYKMGDYVNECKGTKEEGGKERRDTPHTY